MKSISSLSTHSQITFPSCQCARLFWARSAGKLHALSAEISAASASLLVQNPPVGDSVSRRRANVLSGMLRSNDLGQVSMPTMQKIPMKKKSTSLLTAGYENGNTPRILDALKKHQAPATFFVVGNFISDNPDLIRRMVSEGHTVGNHTMTHPDMSGISSKDDFQKTIGRRRRAVRICHR